MFTVNPYKKNFEEEHMKRTRLIALVVALLLVSALFVACGQSALTVTAQYTLNVGETLQIKAEGEGVTYASDKETVATVSAGGLISAVAEGEAVITVKSGDVANKVYVKVVDPACSHRYLEGVCIFCGAEDADYSPVCDHYYIDGICIFCKEENPVKPEKVYHNFTADDLDAIPAVSSYDFQRAMDKDWNIGWDVASLEATAKKVAGIDNSALGENVPASYATAWRVAGDEGSYYFGNGGWCVDMRVWGENSKAVLYNKIENLPANATQFRIWLGTKSANIHMTNQCMFKVTLLSKDADGQYSSVVLKLAEGVIPEGAENIAYTDDGYVKILDNRADNSIGCGDNNETVADGMFVYDISGLDLRGEVTVMIELCGIGDKLGTAETEELGGAKEGNALQEVIVVKRIMFILP